MMNLKTTVSIFLIALTVQFSFADALPFKSKEHIEVEYDTNCTLNAESAIYCGLIINELLTNSFKHAFSEKKSGFIKIDFFKDDNEYFLIYSDNGKGYNPNIKKELKPFQKNSN